MNFDIEHIIAQRQIETHFQPIAAIRRQSVIGVEALSRGVVETAHGVVSVPPLQMFEQAQSAGCALELDRVCREIALERFVQLRQNHPDLILFLNFDLSTLRHDSASPHDLLSDIEARGIVPHQIAIEVLEHEIESFAQFKNDIEHLRSCGFLMAMDDVGAGHSNLDRIAHVRPDILKIDRALLHGIAHDYHQQEVFKSLVNLSEKIGGWTISEGIEDQNDALMALSLGGDIMQGFYFARPHRICGDIEYSISHIHDTAQKFKAHTLQRLTAQQDRHARRMEIVEVLRNALQSGDDEFETSLRAHIAPFDEIESVCVVDENGVQCCETVTAMDKTEAPKQTIFKPPSRGTDHSMKEYFYCVGATSDPFVSSPYVPLPSGKLCVTISTRFQTTHGKIHVLCVHFDDAPLPFEPEPLRLQGDS